MLNTRLPWGVGFLSPDDLDVDRFAQICAERTDPADYPLARAVERNIVVYDAETLTDRAATPAGRRQVLAELNACLGPGPGALAITGMVRPEIVDRATEVYWQVIADEQAAGIGAGDHYADPGLNNRIWNSLQKLAERDPQTFCDYFACPSLDLVCEAWLGPAYRLTAQVNVVRPGGRRQRPHRDYHVGFLDPAIASAYPTSIHVASQLLTLQGGISHCDMAIESGPTQLLPYSHHYDAGFLAYRHPDFDRYFAEHFVQVPLRTGDGVFFSPALFHAAGDNDTAEVLRMVNLFQVSSPFGKPMEDVDTVGMTRRAYPHLRARYEREGLSPAVEALITVMAEGYPFPGNLDRTPPTGGMAPPSERELVRTALVEGWSAVALAARLARQREDRRP